MLNFSLIDTYCLSPFGAKQKTPKTVIRPISSLVAPVTTLFPPVTVAVHVENN